MKNQKGLAEIMEFVRKNWSGILLCLIIAVPSTLLGNRFPIIGGPVIAILAGMIITLLIRDKSSLQSGITFTSKKILQYAVIFLGFGLNLSVILSTGKQSLPIIISTIAASLIISYILCHLMKMPAKIPAVHTPTKNSVSTTKPTRRAVPPPERFRGRARP